MLRLTALLCASMFVTMLVGGRDYGQLRPGLLAAQNAPAAAKVVVAAEPAAEPQVIAASFTPSDATEVTALALPLVQPAPVQAAPVAAEAPAPQAEASAKVWYVDARSVNVRMGPSTDDAILGRLTRGEAATVLGIDNTGWAHIVIEGDGIDGFVSSEFLTPTDPNGN